MSINMWVLKTFSLRNPSPNLAWQAQCPLWALVDCRRDHSGPRTSPFPPPPSSPSCFPLASPLEPHSPLLDLLLSRSRPFEGLTSLGTRAESPEIEKGFVFKGISNVFLVEPGWIWKKLLNDIVKTFQKVFCGLRRFKNGKGYKNSLNPLSQLGSKKWKYMFEK